VTHEHTDGAQTATRSALGRGRIERAAGQRSPLVPGTTEGMLGLQATAGNRAVEGMVQRKLDATRFSKAGFRAAGLKPGFRLSGKTKFGKLEAALADYHAAKSRSEELVALDGVEAACDTWLQSAYRTKKHSAKKAAEEADKNTEITALKVEVKKERDEILSTIDHTTAASLDGTAAAGASVATLARALGLSPNDLKPMHPDNLRQLYASKVYLPYRAAEKAAQDQGMPGQVAKLMEQLGGVDASKLPDGDTKDLVAKIQQSGITDKNRVGSEYEPKYATGGVTTEQVKPNVPNWADTSEIAIKGGDDFRTKVKAMIPVIAATAVGKLLLEGLGGAEPDLEGTGHANRKQVVATIQLPKVTGVKYLTGGGEGRYEASTGGSTVTFDPENALVGTPGQEAAEPWRLREPVIALFHELVHVYLNKKGGEKWREGGAELQVGDQGDVAELRIVGVDYKVKKPDGTGEVTMPFSSPSRNPITENEFRRQFAEIQGQATFLMRPSYGRLPGQIPLPTTPQKV
jgi:Effector protein